MIFELSSKLSYGLCMVSLLPGYGLLCGLVSSILWIGLRPWCGLFCRDAKKIGLEDQGCHCLKLNDMLGGN